MTPARAVRIDIVSDVVCPWCYLGKRRLERAVALADEVEVAIGWRPFRLDPTIPPEGIDRAAYIARKFGDPRRLDAAHARLAAFGRAEGIDYAFDRIGRSPDTTDAHRLIRWAGETGHQNGMVERLFALYFVEGADIGDRAVLVAAAQAGALQADTVARDLASGRDREAVAADLDLAGRLGVSGVPCFVLDGRTAVMGAEAPENIAAAIRSAAEDPREPVALWG